MFLGAHVSIAGGFDKCLDRITDLGGNCLMTFASSPRSLKTREYSEFEIKKYLDKKSQSEIGPHFLHGIYLVNLASESKSLLDASINSLIFYQRFAAEIGAIGTIFHVGSHKGRGFSETMDQIIASINYILDSTPKGIKLILENAAGHSGIIGADFSEFTAIINRVGDKSKLGFCLDTQHAFATGIALNELLSKFDKAVGIKHLTAIHFNDSKSEFGSRLDRHQNLGQGTIGIENLKAFVQDIRLKNTPIILEVPGDGNGPGIKDLDALKLLVK